MRLYQLPQTEAFVCAVRNCKYSDRCAAAVPARKATVHPKLQAEFEEHEQSVMLTYTCTSFAKEE